jgi:hypothetical protein
LFADPNGRIVKVEKRADEGSLPNRPTAAELALLLQTGAGYRVVERANGGYCDTAEIFENYDWTSSRYCRPEQSENCGQLGNNREGESADGKPPLLNSISCDRLAKKKKQRLTDGKRVIEKKISG